MVDHSIWLSSRARLSMVNTLYGPLVIEFIFLLVVSLIYILNQTIRWDRAESAPLWRRGPKTRGQQHVSRFRRWRPHGWWTWALFSLEESMYPRGLAIAAGCAINWYCVQALLHIGNGGNGGAPWADDCFIADVSSCAKIFLRAIVS